MLVIVTAPHFIAGFVVERDRVVRSAPILGRLRGKTFREARAACQVKEWAVEVYQLLGEQRADDYLAREVVLPDHQRMYQDAHPELQLTVPPLDFQP